jgi:LysR family transcriptional activator of mexEF-oprN operon
VRPHLSALIDASLGLEAFDPASSTRTFRIGMSDAMESWLLPALLRALQRDAPHMRFIVTQVQFRTVGRALAERHVDFAVTVADELPASVRRQPLMSSGFVCLFDPRHAGIKQRVSERAYFAHEHVIVSYNSDLRGIIEDAFGKTRRVRCSVSTFSSIGAIVDGTALLATVPDVIARHIVEIRPHLRTARLPATLAPGHEAPSVDLLWLAADDDDPASAFVRAHIAKVASRLNLNR